jgi:ATP-binding cassette subfamily B protein
VLVLWYGAVLVQGGEMSAGELTRFLLYTMFVAGAMGTFAELYSQFQRAIGATQRVREILHEAPEPVLLSTAPSLFSREPRASADSALARGSRLNGAVEYRRVSFSYPSRKEAVVLSGLSLVARAGERVALVGPSGAGKSTIVALLLRFYDPNAGQILIDGKDVRDFPLAELRGQLAIVPQEVLLFGGTLAENIAYGKPGANEAEIIDAARKAHAHDFIRSFPEGYQTRVGERGVQLSGGQRQRVAIARAILKDPAILILDEATSSLDSESESLVQQALDELMRGRTSLIIAHRLATVRGADRIYVIKEGEAVETGTHAELIERKNGLYRALSELQFDLH